MPIQKKHNSGFVKNVTQVTLDGIHFRSKLEAYTYKRLKEEKLLFKYEEDKFILMDKFDFPNISFEVSKDKTFKEVSKNVRAITYTPDFTNLTNKYKWVIECKGNPNDAFPLRWKLFKQYISKSNLKIDLYLPRNKKQVDTCINEIIKKTNNK